MVGVVGSNPIVPTKHCHLVAEKKGDPKGSPFFVSKKNRARQHERPGKPGGSGDRDSPRPFGAPKHLKLR